MALSDAGKGAQLTLNEAIQYFNAGIEKAEIYLSPARDSKLQLARCHEMDFLQQQATRIKIDAIQQNDENVANLFLAFECAIGAVRAELLMWLLLKQEKPNKAWDQLISAQIACLDATRAHTGFSHCSDRLQKLQNIEETIFPPQVFLSAGFVAQALECSICRQRYGTCGHLRGKPYMGMFCEVIHRGIQGDHVAIVEVPADKRCRIVSFKTKDGHRDRLSWDITPYAAGETHEDGGPLHANTIFMSLNRYPYLTSSRKVLDTDASETEQAQSA
ncbi:UNVERIFIED_ORG: hypothetical protein DFO49_5055 [Herbaspirillum seropedicae]